MSEARCTGRGSRVVSSKSRRWFLGEGFMELCQEFMGSREHRAGFPSVIFGAVSHPADQVQDLPSVALGVEYLRDLVMLLAFDVNGRGSFLLALGEIFFVNRLKKRYMEDVVYPLHRRG